MTVHLTRATRIALIAVMALLTVVVGALAQGNVPLVNDPNVDMLATAAGISSVVFIVTSLLRGVVPSDVFDRWGPVIAVIVGIVFALLGTFAAGNVTSTTIIQAVLIGLFGGGFSQNLNTIATRAIRPTT